MWFFNYCGKDYVGVNNIHPMKQELCYEIINSSIPSKSNKIVVFGSGVNITHSKYSDLDIAIELVEDNKKNRRYVYDCLLELTGETDFDLLFINDIKDWSPIFDVINEEGVVIYERKSC